MNTQGTVHNQGTEEKQNRITNACRIVTAAPLKLLLAAALVIALVCFPLLTRANDSNGHVQSLKGTLTGNWMVTVTPVPAAPVFLSLVTYFADGNLLQETSNPVMRSTGCGDWERVGHQQFAQSITFFRFDAMRIYLGTRVVKSTLTLSEDGNQYLAESVGQNFDTSGNLLTTSQATEVGQRF